MCIPLQGNLQVEYRGCTHIILFILAHLAYRANAKKCVISNDNVTVLKAHGKRTLPDVNCYCKMTSEVELDGVK